MIHVLKFLNLLIEHILLIYISLIRGFHFFQKSLITFFDYFIIILQHFKHLATFNKYNNYLIFKKLVIRIKFMQNNKRFIEILNFSHLHLTFLGLTLRF